MFLDVGQIISGYTLEGTLSPAGRSPIPTALSPASPTAASCWGQGRYTRPADHHLRAAGGRALRALADDAVPPPAILSLIQWVSRRRGAAAVQINGIRNRFGGGMRARPA